MPAAPAKITAGTVSLPLLMLAFSHGVGDQDVCDDAGPSSWSERQHPQWSEMRKQLNLS